MKLIKVILILFLFYSCQKNESLSLSYPDWIGDIEFDEKFDNPDFFLCDESRILQYFNFSEGVQYEGEKYAIEKVFSENFESHTKKGESGLVRIRFVVNCEGDTDRFRLISMDENYRQKEFDKSITHQLIKIAKSLKGWKPMEYKGEKKDYYQYLIFKIEDGELKEILP